MNTTTPTLEKRRGNTGVWSFLFETPEGNLIATSEWGTNHEFDKAYWLALPVIES